MATCKFEDELTSDQMRILLEGFFSLVGMIPAGMNRKARIEALERAASDTTKPAETRLKAWEDAGKLKAQQKAAKRLAEGNKD